MRSFLRAALLVCLVGSTGPVLAHPIIPAHERLHDEEIVQTHAGRLLLEELNCVACHQTDTKLRPKQAPILSEVSGRVKPDHLRKFIADPESVKPGTTMPNVFTKLNEQDRDAAVEALVHFLYSFGPGQPEQSYASSGGRVRGESLFHEVGCAACHDPAGKSLPNSISLAHLPEKYTLASLKGFLLAPHQVRPSGRMPNLNLSAAEATDLATYLLPNIPAKAGIGFTYYEGDFRRLADFDKFPVKNTGAATSLHPRQPAQRGEGYGLRFDGMLDLATAGSYKFYLGSDDGSRLTIDGKVVINNDGVHGMQWKSNAAELTAGRHTVRIDYFETSGQKELKVEYEGPGIERQAIDSSLTAAAPEVPLEDIDFVVNADLAAKGKALFSSLGCAACHETQPTVTSTRVAPGFSELRTDRGCLAETPTDGVNFGLTTWQRKDLRNAVADGLVDLSDEQQVRHSILQFNCVACHERDGLGGVEASRVEHFQTTQPEMGMEGSIPPPLNGVGGKLTRAWLDNILAEGAKDRPYMLTRMPKFGSDNVGHLAGLFEKLDQIPALPKLDIPRRAAKKAGHRLVGAQGFSCIKCHTFGRYKATGVQSIDMTVMSKRLREDWFRQYVRNPLIYRKGTRMPSAWPSEKSMLPTLLDGSSEKQIAAVWTFLQDGKRAKTPSGLMSESQELIPGDEAIIYRNFIEGAGSRAIGIGYPEALHVAFDANDLRLALIWQGAFIDAGRHWTGRGQGYQPPAGERVRALVGGAPIATLASADADWPTKSARDLGYKFGGYRLASDQRPTFLYRTHDLQVEDFPNPVETDISASLSRVITVRGSAPDHTFMRLAKGTIVQEGDWYQLGDGLRLRISNSDAVQPIVRGAAGSQELLVPLTGSAPQRIIQLEYVW